MKRLVALLVAVMMFVSAFCLQAFAYDASFIGYVAEGKKECMDPSDIFNFVLAGGHESAPIRIVPAKLNQGGEERDIYLIGLVGVETQKNQVNVFATTIPAAFNKENIYTKLIKETLKDKIPAGADIVLAGHSLGGMVAQQIAADKEVKDNYNIITTITAGSPYIMTKDREGTLVRLCDKYDAVPYLSPATLVRLDLQLGGFRIARDCGYFFNPDGAHNLSYRQTEYWNDLDALAVKDGDSQIYFDYADIILVGRVPN